LKFITAFLVLAVAWSAPPERAQQSNSYAVSTSQTGTAPAEEKESFAEIEAIGIAAVDINYFYLNVHSTVIPHQPDSSQDDDQALPGLNSVYALPFVEPARQWGQANRRLLFWLGIGSGVVFVVSLLSLPWLIALIPEDYFVPEKRHPAPWKDRHPAVRLLALIVKNLLGLVLMAGGILMLIVPGQGILTMVAGVLLLDYPGKFRFERWLAGRPPIFYGLNWLRGKADKPPLVL
jgi:hypothetical protein